MKTFRELGLSEELLEAIEKKGFTEPTEIQEKAIPLALAGKDIIGGSATGSGKTLAFASAIIDNMKPSASVQALILTPTRELAEQVADMFKEFSDSKDLNVTAVYGGVGIEPQIKMLRRTDVVVGTPGRILDHLNRNTLWLGHVKFLVLDEVDRMFDMGFRRDVEKIINYCPKQRQTMLFSATISAEIDYLAKKHTKDAVEVAVQSLVDPAKLKQVYYDVDARSKFSLLAHLLKNEKAELVMVFCNTRRIADSIERNMGKIGIDCVAIHGGLSQNRRSKVLEQFHGKGCKVLICTDVAARGLDIKGVSHVYNFDAPQVSNDYVHRIGRTARAGADGIAVSLISNRDYEYFDKIMRIENINITRLEVPQFEQIEIKTSFGSSEGHSGRRSFGGGRGGFGRGGGRDFVRRDSRGSSGRTGSRSFGRRPHSESQQESDGDRREHSDRRGGFGRGRDRRGGSRSFGGRSGSFGRRTRY